MGEASAAQRAQTQADICTWISRICQADLNMQLQISGGQSPHCPPWLQQATPGTWTTILTGEELRNGDDHWFMHIAQLPKDRAIPSVKHYPGC